MTRRTRNGQGPGNALRFAFECPRSWDSLAPTDDPSVRHCDHCSQRVYRCGDGKDARMHGRVGHCVAVPASSRASAPMAERVTLGMLGPSDLSDAGGPDLATLVWLVVLDGPQRGEVFRLSEAGHAIIGSGEGAHIRLHHDADIKPEHCRIVVQPGRFFLCDARLDDRREELCDNDVFTVGNTRLGFKSV